MVEKVVLARWRAVAPPPGHRFSPGRTARCLALAHPRALVFVLGDGGGRALIGATPETLLRWRGRRICTHAVAGTAWGAGAGAELRVGPTLRAEQAAVVRGIMAELEAHCLRLSARPTPTILRLGAVSHLETPIKGLLRASADLRAVLRDLHPTPAMCGTPRAHARRWLREHEPLARGAYAGHFGWEQGDRGVSAVLIRCAMLHEEHAVLYAGGGIVRGAEPGREWQETEEKLRTVARALRTRGSDDR